MSSPTPNDYSALISQASAEVDKKAQAQQLRESRRKKNTGQQIAVAVCTLVVSIAGYQIWSRLAPPGDKQVAKDLENTVEQARAVIDQTRKETGQLPDALPAAMASVVRYEKTDKAYKLSATVLGVRVTMESDGPKRTDFGVKQ